MVEFLVALAIVLAVVAILLGTFWAEGAWMHRKKKLAPYYFLRVRDDKEDPQVFKIMTKDCDVVVQYKYFDLGITYESSRMVDAAVLWHRDAKEYLYIRDVGFSGAERVTQEEVREILYKQLSTEKFSEIFPNKTYDREVKETMDRWEEMNRGMTWKAVEVEDGIFTILNEPEEDPATDSKNIVTSEGTAESQIDEALEDEALEDEV